MSTYQSKSACQGYRTKLRDTCADCRVKDALPYLVSSTIECGYGAETIAVELPVADSKVPDLKLIFSPKDKNCYTLDFNIALTRVGAAIEIPTELPSLLECFESLRFDFEFDAPFPDAMEYHSMASVRVPADFTEAEGSQARFRPALTADVTISGRVLTLRFVPGLIAAFLSQLNSDFAGLTGFIELLTAFLAEELCFRGQIDFTPKGARIGGGNGGGCNCKKD